MVGQSRRSGKKLIMVGAAVALVVAALGAGMAVGPKLLHRPDKKETAEGKEGGKEADGKGGKSDKAEKSGKGGEDKQDEAAVVVPLGEFLVNLDNGGKEARYLRAEVAVRITGLPASKGKGGHGGKKGEGGPLPADDVAVARDRVVTVLSAGAFSQLRSAAGREALKHRLLVKLRDALPNCEISEVLFTSFVMQ